MRGMAEEAAVRAGVVAYPPPQRGWYIVAVIVGALLLSALDRQALILLIPSVQADLGLSDTEVSLLQGVAYVVLYAVFTLIVGWLADRYDRRTIIIIGVVVWSFMTAACGFMTSFVGLFLARGGVGGGEATVVPAGYALVADSFPPDRRGRLMGVINAASNVGCGSSIVIGSLILGMIGPERREIPLLGSATPWQLTFILLGLLGLPISGLLLTIRDIYPRHREPIPTPGATDGPGPIEHLREHALAFLGVFGAATCNNTAGLGLSTWAPTLLVRRFGMTAPHAGYVIGFAFLIGGTLGSLSAAAMSDRWVRRELPGGRMRGHTPILALAFIGTCLFTLAPSPIVAGAGFTAIAFSLNAIAAISFTALQDLAPPGLRGRLTGYLQFCVIVVGFTVGPFAIATLTDRIFHDQQKLPMSALIFGTSAFLLAMALTLVSLSSFSHSARELVAKPADGIRS